MNREETARQQAARLLKTAPGAVKMRPLPDDDATYCWTEGRGGAALIIGGDRTVLYANSSVAPQAHIEAFRSGRRTPPEQFAG